jgi:hypothetical protein
MNFKSQSLSKTAYVMFFISSTILFLSNKNGVPQAVTKAPGESGLSCDACHSPGTDYKTTVDMTLMNLDSTEVTSYEPGKKYIVRVKVAGTNSPKSYGFQMVSLAASDNKDVGLWSSLGPRVKQVTLLQRKYIEQSNTQDNGLFYTQWTAPAGGDVKFYMSGMAVNGNGSTSGDKAASNVKTYFANGISSTNDGKLSTNDMFYRHLGQELIILNDAIKSVEIFDNRGMLIINSTQSSIDLSAFSIGNYIAVAYDGNRKQVGKTQRFAKI